MYRALFIFFSFLILLWSFVNIAIPPAEFVAFKLAQNPDEWEITFKSSNPEFYANPERAKYFLLDFVDMHHRKFYMRLDEIIFICFAISAVFCLIGWIREASMKKIQAQQGAAANP